MQETETPASDLCFLPLASFILPRVLELTYTAWDLQPFAQECGYAGPPFVWDEERRFLLRCELDAVYFHLYGIAREDVTYIMETFPIVKRKDEAAHGEYRTQRVILEMYDAMARGTYQTRLDPPPADPRAAHPWDETYLGPPRDSSAWWREMETSPQERAAASTHGVKEPSSVFELQSPPLPTPRQPKPASPAAAELQQTFLKTVPAPGGSRAARLKQALDLQNNFSPIATRALVALLADVDSNIVWLAGSSLVHRASLDVVVALAAFLESAAPEQSARALPEARRILRLIAETAEDAGVREKARALLAAYGEEDA